MDYGDYKVGLLKIISDLRKSVKLEARTQKAYLIDLVFLQIRGYARYLGATPPKGSRFQH